VQANNFSGFACISFGVHMKDYTALGKKLETRRTELQDRLERLKKDVTREHSSDWPDQAQERENDEVLDKLGDGTQQELLDIDAALKRLKAGTYGTCIECGCEIPLARLQVKPEAATCVKCAA